MALKNFKKRKSLSSVATSASPKKKNQCASSSKNMSPYPQDGRGCSLLTKLIDSGVVPDHEPVFYLRKRDKYVMKEGILTREGVICKCCSQIFLLSRFEVHAGSGLHRPSANMFLEDGRSLMQCQQSIEIGDVRTKTLKCSQTDRSHSIQSKILQTKISLDKDRNDNTCQTCGDGGQLILCDTCPSAFHPDCLGLHAVPDGEWNCPRCCCGACGGPILNSGTQTSVTVVAPSGYLQRIVEGSLEATRSPSCDGLFQEEDDSRLLARPRLETDVSIGNKERSVIFCAHCWAPHHFNCIKGRQHQSDVLWFCSKNCKLVSEKLHNLVGHPFTLDRGLSCTVVCSFQDDGSTIQSASVRASFERKLSEAYKIVQECFDPMIDAETGVDMLSQTLFNKKAELRRLDCRGFHTMLLMKGDQMASVATFRVHGQMLAEMPFIATKQEYRQQGMCRALMRALESILIDIGVYRLVLPSVDELLETWQDSFGFRVMTLQERQQISQIAILPFVGTTLLHKSLMKPDAENIQNAVPETVESKTKPGFLRIKLKLSDANKPATSFQPISCH